MIHRNKNGFVGLIVLVAVAIMMILYFVQMSALFGPAGTHVAKGIEDHPWVLQDLLVPENENVKLPRKPKPALDEPLTVNIAVSLDGADRGQVTITFEPNGRINSRWECSYLSEGLNYRILTDMNGNIDAKRTYQDENGKDKSRLFFIAKGTYTKTPSEANAAIMGEKGTSWLTGWLSPSQSIEGHITITTNQQWAGVYELSGTK